MDLRKNQDSAEDKQFAELSNEIVKAKSVLHDNTEDTMALHFDWLEGIKAQIKEVQGRNYFSCGFCNI